MELETGPETGPETEAETGIADLFPHPSGLASALGVAMRDNPLFLK